MERLIKKLATELAQRDYNELSEMLEDMTFIEAYNMLKGFNLEMDTCTCKGELLSIQIRFDYNFNHINGTIFRIDDGSFEGACELYQRIAVWDDEFSSPIIECLEMEC